MDVTSDLREYIDDGARIILAADAFAPCGVISTEIRPRFDVGFDLASTGQNGGTVVGVNPDLTAYHAGLRDGMRIVAREAGETGNSMSEMALRVNDNGTERVMRYLPQGRDSTEVQSLTLTKNLAKSDLETCSRRLCGV